MAIGSKKSHAQAVRDLQRVSQRELEESELVTNRSAAGGQPFSVRLSVPLLERLDRLARQENRKRGNLIQHILWQYVRERDAR